MSSSMILPPAKDHTFLLLPFSQQSYTNPEPFFPIIFNVLKHSSLKSLTVICSTPASDYGGHQLYDILRSSPRDNWRGMQRFLGGVYATLAAAQWACGRVLMDVEVAFDSAQYRRPGLGTQEEDDSHTIVFQGFEDLAKADTLPILPRITSTLPLPSYSSTPQIAITLPSPVPGPSTSALGGTFDHLHAAHKLLLHLSLFLSTSKLIVGLMSDSLLFSKSNARLVQPLSERIAGVEGFLSRCGARRLGEGGGVAAEHESEIEGRRGEDGIGEGGTGVIMDVVEIHDAYGPTAWDNDIDGLVVSMETFSGGEMVNSLRREKGLKELELFVIDVIASDLVDGGGEVGGVEVGGGEVGRGEVGSGLRDDGVLRELRRGSESVRTVDLSEERDEKRLKELKMGSTAIRQWLAKRQDQGRDADDS